MMQTTVGLYRQSLAMLTDLYQLTMAYGYWRTGVADREAVFHLAYRTNPFEGGFAVACGLPHVVELLRSFHFAADDLAYLAELTGVDGRPLFPAEFLDHLQNLSLRCDIDAVAEGTVVFPHEPLVRVRGPLLECQLLETALLNVVNFQTLIATKAARICLAAEGDDVVEFGLRRAQGADGGLSASRAAYVGGCAATSNVLAGKLFGIPVKGTHAHSWIMSFDTEREAFAAYAEAMPSNCIFLVDTYHTLDGVRNAVAVGKQMREAGHEMVGIRLDSGDLAYLSIEARRILDENGFPDAVILASSELDEHIIASLKDQGAKIDVWGVGTKLATAYDDPALGGVYKLGAVRRADGAWDYKVKLSDQTVKTSNPGVLQVRRWWNDEGFIADAIYDEALGVESPARIVDPSDPLRRKQIPADAASEDLLVPIFRQGELVHDPPSLDEARRRAHDQLARLHPTIKRFVNPHVYPAGLETRLHALKTELILEARGHA